MLHHGKAQAAQECPITVITITRNRPLRGERLNAEHAALCYGVRQGTVTLEDLREWMRRLSDQDVELLVHEHILRAMERGAH